MDFNYPRFLSYRLAFRSALLFILLWAPYPGPSFSAANVLPEVASAEQPQQPSLHAPRDTKALELPSVVFSSNGSIGDYLMRAIDSAQESIDLTLYTFDYSALKRALEKAYERGVRIRVILNAQSVYPSDKQSKGHLTDSVAALKEWGGGELRTLRGIEDSFRGIQHNKILIIDGKLLQTGSFNWMDGSDRSNHENAMFLRDKALIKAYKAYFEFLWSKAHPLGEDVFGAGDPDGIINSYAPSVTDAKFTFNGVSLPVAAFSPRGGVAAKIIKAINATAASLDIAVFTINMYELTNAILAAQKRGVYVRIITDKKQALGESQVKSTAKLISAGVRFRVHMGLNQGGGHAGAMHHKFAIFDGTLLENGSFNWTFGGEIRNFDSILFTRELGVLSAFKSEFNNLWDIARPLPQAQIENLLQNLEPED